MPKLEKYTKKLNITYLTWIMLWVNAVPDTAVLIDWPDCSFFKSDIIYKNHDMFSTLKSTETNHRIYYTWLTVNNLITWHEKKVKKELLRIKEDKKIHFSFVTTFPMAKVLGLQYNMIIKDLWLQNHAIEIKWSIRKDWLDGYEEILLWLAKWLNLKNKIKDQYGVSIVWNLFDRNEWDCKWNIKELKRILQNIWVRVNSIWLSWKNINYLKNIEKSKYIISLPYWRKAAKEICKKTWAKLIETILPFSPQSTEIFLLDIWKNIWLDLKKIKDFIKYEKRKFFYNINIFINKYFLGKKVSFILDPNLIKGFINLSEILGFDIEEIIWVSKNKKLIIKWKKIKTGISVYQIKTKNSDLIIKNSLSSSWKNEINFWFPNTTNHYIIDTPYLWFNGSLNLFNIILNYFINKKDLETFLKK